jgi:Na+-transporting NADH:ubiquinone oxidoreductase subunit NqrB
MTRLSTLFFLSLFITSPALASSDAAWAALDRASAKACLHATGFLNATVSPPTRFSDGIGYDVRIVSGTYPQKHMKGTRGQMLCLFQRRTGNVEVQELAQ